VNIKLSQVIVFKRDHMLVLDKKHSLIYGNNEILTLRPYAANLILHHYSQKN